MEVLKPSFSKWLNLLEKEDYPEISTRQDWPHLAIKDKEEIKDLGKYIQKYELPKLARNFDKYRLAIASLMPFIDSRKLDFQTRRLIGLSPFFKNKSLVEKSPPDLYVPKSSDEGRGWLCFSTESMLKVCSEKLEGYGPSPLDNPLGYWKDKVPFDLMGCMIAKTYGFVAGVCYKTTEFPNGKVFIKDIIYLSRKSGDLVKKLQKLSETAAKLEFMDEEPLYRNEQEIKITRDLVVWENCGGIWEPIRGFGQPSDPIPMEWW